MVSLPLKLAILAVKFTGGDVGGRQGSYFTVSKRDRIAGLQAFLQMEQLRIASGVDDGELLMTEKRGVAL